MQNILQGSRGCLVHVWSFFFSVNCSSAGSYYTSLCRHAGPFPTLHLGSSDLAHTFTSDRLEDKILKLLSESSGPEHSAVKVEF